MRLQFITPNPELKPYISKIWIFENETGLINHGTLIAPNAKPKIIIPYTNALTTTDNGKTDICAEGDIFFIGIRDVPVSLGTTEGKTGSIGLELTTESAYKFLNVPMFELTNKLFSFSDLYGTEGKQILQKMADKESPNDKLILIQDFLRKQLTNNERTSLIVDYSVNFISSLRGLGSIKELERKTGYTKRYLDLLFKDYLGISPKTLSTIVRFQSFYKLWHQFEKFEPAGNSFLDSYYDQSHFIKEFKRYTGYTPMRFSGMNNDFGKHF